MRSILRDNQAAYGIFLLLGVFAVCIIIAGYFIGATNILSSGKDEAIGHSTTYQGISKEDLLRIVEEAALVASREGGTNGWDEDQVDSWFKTLAEEWISKYMAERGVYNVNITVERESDVKERGEETYIDLGKYVLVVSGLGVKTEVVVE